jgi:hypothetical protein
VANSYAFSIEDPAVYAVWIERIHGTAGTELPFEECSQDGHLFPRTVDGDNEE